MYLRYLTFLLFSVFIFASCSSTKSSERLVDKDKNAFARQAIDDILAADTIVLRKIDAEVKPEEVLGLINYVQKVIGTQKYKSANVIGLKMHYGTNDTPTYTINYQYEYEKGYAFFSVTLNKNAPYRIIEIYVDTSREPFTKNSEFTLKGKGILHYLVIILVAAIFVFIVVSIIILAKTQIKRKWLWVIFVVMGNLGFGFNWYTGNFISYGIKFLFLGVGYEQGNVYESWMFSLSIPLGAIMFWIKRNKLKRQEREYNELVAMYPDQSYEQNQQEELNS